ncbi:MAG: DUF2306 domain-containing protein [Chryseobacterium sp.]|nr:DUF2306 domain-containing protein [Chryseobacterium sp.]
MKKFLFVLICIFAILIGLYPLIYIFVDHKNTFIGSKAPEILQSMLWKVSFFAHIIFGGLSLLVGWRQFGSGFRKRYPKIHRNIGIVYIFSVVISSLSGIYIGLFANGGWISALGFVGLGIIWFGTTVSSFLEIKKNNIMKHQQLMVYSYACTFAAVTLRLWFPALKSLSGDPDLSYLIVAWLCWIPNLIVAYFINRTIQNKIEEL